MKLRLNKCHIYVVCGVSQMPNIFIQSKEKVRNFRVLHTKLKEG